MRNHTKATVRWLMAPLLLALLAGPVQAHAMFVRYRVLPGNQVQVEGFFQGGAPAVDGIVRVYRPDGSLLCPPGVLDEKGLYTFSYTKAEDLKVKVSLEEHVKEKLIPAQELTDAPPAERTEPSRLAEMLAGLSLILALAAFWISLRNAARLRAVQATAAVSSQAAETPRPAALPTGPGRD